MSHNSISGVPASLSSITEKDVRQLKSLLVEGRFADPPVQYMDLINPLLTFILLRRRSFKRMSDPASSPLLTPSEVDDLLRAPSEESKNRLEQNGLEQQAQKPTGEEQFSGDIMNAVRYLLVPKICEKYFLSPLHDITNSPKRGEDGRPNSTEATTSKDNDKGTEMISAATQPSLLGTRHRNLNTTGTRKRLRAGDRGGVKCELLSIALGNYNVSYGDDDSVYQLLLSLLSAAADHYCSGFSSDAAFLQAMEALMVLQYKFVVVDRHASTVELDVMRAYQIDPIQHLAPLTHGFLSIIRVHVERRLQRMEKVPHVIRLSRKLKLTEKETVAMVYLAVAQSGTMLPLTIDRLFHPASVARWNGMDPTELHDFLRDDRTHIHQGIVVVSEITCVPESKVMLPQEVASALSGAATTQEQMAKLEKTALGEILVEDDENSEEDPEEEEEDRKVSPSQKGNTIRRGSVKKRLGRQKFHLDDGNEGEARADEDEEEGDEEEEEEEVELNGSDNDDDKGKESQRNHGINEKGTLDKAPVVSSSSISSPPPTPSMPSSPQTLSESSAKIADGGSSAVLVPQSSDPSSLTGPTFSPVGKTVDVATSLLPAQMNVPYNNNFECMEGSFYIISLMIKIRNMEGDIKEEEERGKRKKDEAVIRGMEGKLRVAQTVHESRVKATMNAGVFVPAIEALSMRFQLSEMEKNVLLLLVGNAISHDVLVAINGRYFMREGQRFMTVGYILFVLCKGLQQRVEARQVFYQSSRLISNSIISLSVEPATLRTCFNTDLMEYSCDIDRKIVDLVMGRETESQEMVPGSSVITPTVSLDKVVLPRALMEKVLSRVEHFSLVNECKKNCGFGEGLGESSNGVVILFYGPSGTGKTMLAHAIANELKKKLLLVNVAAFKGTVSAPDMLRFLFREAKLRDAIIFFDECEDLFTSRTENPLLTTLLAEFEKYDGMILMATNAAQVFDESMNRRISLMIEFKPPDHSMRLQIWLSHIPKKLALADDVSVERIALNYELTGGLIRNAVLAAINSAVARCQSATPTLQMEDFETGAKQQLRGFFMAANESSKQSNYLTPRRRLEELVLDVETKSKIAHVARLSKSRSTLFSLWGFNEENAGDQGSIYLFYGPAGTGKSLAAEGIAYECGLTIRLCDAPSLMHSMQANSRYIASVFEEAQKLGAMVVVDESQYFFQHSMEEDVMRIFLYYALRHSKPVIMTATSDPKGYLDLTRHTIPIVMTVQFSLPRKAERLQLWSQVFPTAVPLEKGMVMEELSEFAASPRQIERVAFRACCKAALLPADARVVSLQMIKNELEEEIRREQARTACFSMFA